MSYQKFVVITYPRSGTHMLRTMLTGHANAVCHGEMFNPNKQDLPYGHSVSVEDVLEQWIYKAYNSDINAVGFVHHAYHPGVQKIWPDNRSNAHWQGLWQQLQKIDGLKVVVLRRENLLYRHLSQLMARQTGHWQSYANQQLAESEGKIYREKPTERPAITVDAQLLKQDIEETLEYRDFVRDVFKDKPILDVSYEHLCYDRDAVSRELQDFLGLPYIKLEPSLQKLEDRPLSEAVSNYAELKHQFFNTEFAAYFAD